MILNGTADTSYEDSDVEELTDYSYRVKAQNEVGESLYSEEFTFSFSLFAPVLNVPAQWDESHYGFSLTWEESVNSVDSGRTTVRNPENPAISDWLYRGDITVSWDDDSLVETNYKIYGKYNSGDTYSLLEELPANTEKYVFESSSVINHYYFMIYAYIVYGDGSYILSNQIETNLSHVPLKPIQSMNSVYINGGVRISWGAEWTYPYEGFTLERREGYQGEYSFYRDLTPDLRSFDDTGLDSGQTYFYRITGYTNDYRTSSLEDQIRYLESIATPLGLTVNNVSGTSVEISWNDQSDNETGFLIERKIGSNGTYSQVGTVAANTTVFIDTELDSEIQYFYRVRAQNFSFGISQLFQFPKHPYESFASIS